MPKNLAQKIALLVVVAILATGLINWTLAGLTMEGIVRQEVLNSQRHLADSLARRTEATVGGVAGVLTRAASERRLRDSNPEAWRGVLREMRGNGALFTSVIVVDGGGRPLAWEGADQAMASAGAAAVRDALAGRQGGGSGYLLSRAFSAPANHPAVALAVPVPGAAGSTRLLAGMLDLTAGGWVARVLDSFHLDEAGRLFLVDAEGRVLYRRTRGASLGEPLGGNVPRLMTRRTLQADEGLDASGRRSFLAYAPVARNWGIITAVDAAEALAPISRFHRQAAAVSALTLLLAMALALLVSRRLLSPLNELVRSIGAVSRGDFSVRFPMGEGAVREDDEIGVLATAFNRMMEELDGYNRNLRERATTDAVTGVFNRGSFEEKLAEHLAAARQGGKPLSLLMVDLDDLKGYNDAFGHPAGDQVLRECGRIFRALVREMDVVARYGGEEFVVILPDTDLAVASLVASRLQEAVSQYPFLHRRVTISVGVAGFPMHGTEAHQLVLAADTALYQAKGAGKDRVSLYRPAPAEPHH